MCTSIFTKTEDGEYILSRTMDYSFPLEAAPIYIPKKYQWKTIVNEEQFTCNYGFIGAGRLLGDNYFVADGVNEYGLSVAELYLPGEATYQDYEESSKINLAPHEFILWLLGNVKSVNELRQLVSKINIVEAKAPMLNIVTPLHWIITDGQGECVVIEPTNKDLKIKENSIGVMTNTPLLEWHIENLRNYLNVRPQQFEPIKIGDYVATPFSQGTGTLGLPGGYTPPERFVRAAFLKEFIAPAKNEEEGINNAYHILNTVKIPKGVVVTPDDREDYTLYTGSMVNNSRTYYFSSYENHQIGKLVLDDQLLSNNDPIVFNYKIKQEGFDNLNIKY